MRQEEGKGRKRKHQHQKNRKPHETKLKGKTTNANKTQSQNTRRRGPRNRFRGFCEESKKKREADSRGVQWSQLSSQLVVQEKLQAASSDASQTAEADATHRPAHGRLSRSLPANRLGDPPGTSPGPRARAGPRRETTKGKRNGAKEAASSRRQKAKLAAERQIYVARQADSLKSGESHMRVFWSGAASVEVDKQNKK